VEAPIFSTRCRGRLGGSKNAEKRRTIIVPKKTWIVKQMDIDRYLARIGLGRRPPPTLAGLREVHAAHLLSIPYENLDVQLGRPVSLDPQAIYDKIVVRRRGGWCYEMNGILGWALTELGFKVTRGTGAVMRDMFGDVMVANHLVLRVALEEGVYLADAGVGGGPLDPIPVAEGAFTSNGFTYRLERLDDSWWRFHNSANNMPPTFDFDLSPADETRFALQCRALQSEPHSHFVLNLFCFRHRGDSILMLRGRVRRTLRGDGSYTDRLIESAGDLVATFKTEFDLDVPEAASLWPKICARHDDVMAAEAKA
jgi:N-hydroxyarylamine O-acetyltransferase